MKMLNKLLPIALKTRNLYYPAYSLIVRDSILCNIQTALSRRQPVVKGFHTSCVRSNVDDQSSPSKLPCLMPSVNINVIWPSFFKTLNNYISSYALIAPFYDNEFDLQEFVRGAKQAIVSVSANLADGNFDNLEGMVESKALKEIKRSLLQFTPEQKLSLAASTEDMYLSFPYQVGIMFEESADGQERRFVEITVCSHVFNGLNELRKRDDFNPNPSTMAIYRDRIMICNYRFIREFTKGVEDQWIINYINHFKLEE